MSIARPPAARLVADTSILREARWPRLLAHLDAHLLEVAIERSDRGLTHARRLEAPPPVALGACLKAFLAAAGQSAVGGALVIDGSVAAGRFLPRGQARSIGVETLRLELGLRTLRVIDDLWSDHLGDVTELRAGIQWVSWGGRDPLFEFLTQIDRMFRELMAGLETEITLRIEQAKSDGFDPSQRGATWTYLTTDNPFGRLSDRIRKGIVNKVKSWAG